MSELVRRDSTRPRTTHQGPVGRTLENACRLVHLDPERAPVAVQLVSSAHATEQSVDHADASRICRHVRTGLCKNGDQGGLSEEGTFSGHVLRQ